MKKLLIIGLATMSNLFGMQPVIEEYNWQQHEAGVIALASQPLFEDPRAQSMAQFVLNTSTDPATCYVPHIQQIVSSLNGNHNYYSLEDLARRLPFFLCDNSFVLKTIDGTVSGFIKYDCLFDEKESENPIVIGLIQLLAVGKNDQRKGYGFKLAQRAMQTMARDWDDMTEIQACAPTAATVGLLTKIGFAETNTPDLYTYTPTDADRRALPKKKKPVKTEPEVYPSGGREYYPDGSCAYLE